jgi:resolvase-like protein
VPDHTTAKRQGVRSLGIEADGRRGTVRGGAYRDELLAEYVDVESGVELVCCDMPQTNRLILYILAAVAEHEREMISERMRAALAAQRCAA